MKGNFRENQVAALLREDGWVVGSLRHTRGGGDLIAARPVRWAIRAGRAFEHMPASEVRLVEVKATAAGPYEHFGPNARATMIVEAEAAGGSAWLAYWPARKPLRWIPAAEWPG